MNQSRIENQSPSLRLATVSFILVGLIGALQASLAGSAWAQSSADLGDRPPTAPLNTPETSVRSPELAPLPPLPFERESAAPATSAPTAVSPPPAPLPIAPLPETPAARPIETEAVVAPMPAPAPEVPEVRMPETQSITSLRGRYAPSFQRVRPRWGVEVTSSPNALGGTRMVPQAGTNRIGALHMQIEWQPEALQEYGVFGIGPSIGIYPYWDNGSPTANVPLTPNRLSLWEVGGQLRYQARYFREQPVVPVLSYNFEYVTYNFSGGPSGRFLASGPALGAWFLLNVLQPSDAAEFFVNYGVVRSYLVAEYRSLKGNDTSVTVAGSSWFFGLRVEF